MGTSREDVEHQLQVAAVKILSLDSSVETWRDEWDVTDDVIGKIKGTKFYCGRQVYKRRKGMSEIAIQQRIEQGAEGNAEALRKEEGNGNFLRQEQQVRQEGKVSDD